MEQNRSGSLVKKSAGLQGWKWITVHQFCFSDRNSQEIKVSIMAEF